METAMVELSVRIVDEAENKYDWFSGPASECPPIPRPGDLVGCGASMGAVHRVEHGMDENGAIGGSGPDELRKRYTILIRAQTRPVA
jgi:hypothetical protein